MAFSAAACCAFSKHGKITRAIGFVFIMAAGTLVSHNDEGSWRILIETAAAALTYAVLPLEKVKTAENDFSDSTVSLIIRERLNFAADALEGVGAGITAAADALDKKYSFNIEGISDRAADKVCRSCPKSMVCWGRKYELFRKEFSRLVMQLRTGFELTEFSLSPECAEECVNPAGVAKAISAEYSRYISAMSDERRIRELRRIYTDRLSATQEILREISRSGLEARAFGKNRTAEKRVEKCFRTAALSSRRRLSQRTGAVKFILRLMGRQSRELNGIIWEQCSGKRSDGSLKHPRFRAAADVIG